MNPKASIIIPTYNRAHLISATLNSIQNQTYTNWECIVVDDGSTDETEALLKKYIEKDNRFQFHKRPQNSPKGANACRNFGFSLSKGEFINWFDSDDIMMPDKLELQINKLKANEEAPYCICQSSWFDKENNKSLGLRSKNIGSDNRFEDYILNTIFWLTTAPLWRRDFIVNNNLSFDNTLHQSQEYDFHIKALAVSVDYIIIDKPLVQIVKHNEAISHEIYQDNSKMRSNLSVKAMVLNKYDNKLSNSAKNKLFERITLIFKNLLKLKKFYVAFFAMQVLFKNIKHIKVSTFKKLIFLTKLVVVFVSYRIFGRGYNIIKSLN